MKENISLQRAIRLGIIKECDTVDPTEIFKKENASITLNQDETGYLIKQFLLRERLTWYYMVIDNLPYIVSDQTVQRLYLKGKQGIASGNMAMEKLSGLYCNPRKGIIAKPLSVEIFDKMVDSDEYVERLCKYFNKQLNSSWLADSYKGKKDGIYYMEQDEKYFCQNDEFFENGLYNCFVIKLDSDQIYIDKEYHRKHNIWKFILP